MQSFPFDSYVTYDSQGNPTYDRAVSSQPLRTLIRKLFTTGVMPNPSTNFQVNAGTDGMTVLVQPGFAVVDGGLCKEDEVRTLSVTAADSTYDRIDTVVLRWNENVDVRTADLYVLAGTPAETPVRPALQRNDSIYEIGLADVFITHGIVTITEDKITDTRYESERCGIVSSVSEWDTTTIYQQIQSELAKFKNNEEVAFANWFESMKDQLSEDAAGHLQVEIDKNTKDISDVNGRLTQVQSQIVPTASIESGETASKAYSKGDFLVKDGALYKVTNAIVKDDVLTAGTNIAMTTVGSELSSARSNSFAIKEVLHVASTTTTATDYTTEPLDDYNFFIVSCGVLGFRPGVLYKGSPTGFYSKAELLDTANYSGGTQLIVYDTDGSQGDRITRLKYVNNTSVKLWYAGSYPSEVRIYGIKC